MTPRSKRGEPARRRFLPRHARGWIILTFPGVAAVMVGVFLFVYLVVFPTAAPAPLTLSSPASSASATAAGSVELAGTWKVASGSRAGYRVREQLADLPAQSRPTRRTPCISRSLAPTRPAP